MPADHFKGKQELLERVFTAYKEGAVVGQLAADLAMNEGIVIAPHRLQSRLRRMLDRRALRAVEGEAILAQRAALTQQATEALAGQGAEPLRRRDAILARAEECWAQLPKKQRSSWRLYLALEDLALKYLALQFRVAQVTGDGDALEGAAETLKTKLEAMLSRSPKNMPSTSHGAKDLQ